MLVYSRPSWKLLPLHPSLWLLSINLTTQCLIPLGLQIGYQEPSCVMFKLRLTFWKEAGWCPVFQTIPWLGKAEKCPDRELWYFPSIPTAKLWILKLVSWSFGKRSCFPNEECSPSPWACLDWVIQSNTFPGLKWVTLGQHSSLGSPKGKVGERITSTPPPPPARFCYPLNYSMFGVCLFLWISDRG